jgi:hypothetical protein
VDVTTTIDAASRDFLRASERASTLLRLDDYSDALLDMVENAETPEERQDLINAFDLNELLVQGKVEAYLHTIDNLASLAGRRKALAELLLVHMQRTGQQKVMTDHFTARRQLNPPSAEVYDDQAVPLEFVELRTTRHVLLREIIARVKATGETVDGVTVSQREGIRIQ